MLEAWRDAGYTHLLFYKTGADFVRQEDSRYTPQEWQALDELLAELTRSAAVWRSLRPVPDKPMKWQDYLGLAILGLVALVIVAAFQTAPGYMDAEYYFSGGVRLAGGYGFSEMIVWNYLSDPQGLPHPSHAYWMPLASILAFLGMKALGSLQFTAGRAGFILVAACLPPLTAALAYRLAIAPQACLAGWDPGGIASFLPAFPAHQRHLRVVSCSWVPAGCGWRRATPLVVCRAKRTNTCRLSCWVWSAG